MIFLNGCSDLGFGSCGEDNCDGSDLISTITLNDFVGTWDGSREIANEGRDENYMIVKPSGDVTYYDYQGEYYNLGNNLSFTFAASSPTTPGRFDYTPSTMTESDFVPACTTE